MSLHSSFSYNNDYINVIQIEDNINIRVKKQNNKVVMIYFMNDQGDIIRILLRITVKNITDNTIVRPLKHGR